MTNFFDFHEKLHARRAKSPAIETVRADEDGAVSSAKPKASREMLSVSQLTSIIDRAIRSGVPSTVHVHGELSNVNAHRSSGHLYFTLKDATTCIDCVMWKSDAVKLKFQPTDGEAVMVSGGVEVYGSRGRYQLYARKIEPMGKGALELAFRQLHDKLEREGLFEQERKKPLPAYPTNITLITSRDGAALQDMLKVLRRFAWLKLKLVHVPVQGSGAAAKIAGAIDACSRRGTCDVILLARGGGSLEDLWAFNEEVVARAIAASTVPVVTGIGHEVDISIADLVADHHAHTPTEAAQVVTSSWRSAADVIDGAAIRLRRALRAHLQDATHRLNAVARHEVFRRPTDRINRLRQIVDDQQRAMQIAAGRCTRRFRNRLDVCEARLRVHHPISMLGRCRSKLLKLERALLKSTGRIARTRMQLEVAAGRLEALSPLAVLKRGYSITRTKRGGAVVRSTGDVRAGDSIVTRVADGEFESTIEDSKQPKLF